MTGFSKCTHHPTEPKNGCTWCDKWHKTFYYFKNLKAEYLTVYCVKMKHYRTGEEFYKIGLTSKNLDERFDETRERFEVEVIWDVDLPLYEAVVQETNLLYKHQILEKRRYYPKVKFTGRTECII